MPQTKPLQLYQASHLLNLHILNVLFAQNHYEQEDGMVDLLAISCTMTSLSNFLTGISPRKQNNIAVLLFLL